MANDDTVLWTYLRLRCLPADRAAFARCYATGSIKNYNYQYRYVTTCDGQERELFVRLATGTSLLTTGMDQVKKVKHVQPLENQTFFVDEKGNRKSHDKKNPNQSSVFLAK